MKTLIAVAILLAAVVFGCTMWLLRFSTNTAAGRFYKNDRWTWRTFVVEKDGHVHWLYPPTHTVTD